MRFPRLLLVLPWLACCSIPAAAQVDPATLNGTITDPTGAVIPGVKVEAVSNDTGKQREARTNDDGIYIRPGLPIGVYTFVFSPTPSLPPHSARTALRLPPPLTLNQT